MQESLYIKLIINHNSYLCINIYLIFSNRYKNTEAAIKQFFTKMEKKQLEQLNMDETESILKFSKNEVMKLYRDVRHEVNMLATLNYPYVVNVLGVSVKPLLLVLELAQLGSLHSILSGRLDSIQKEQNIEAGMEVTPDMPGGVLGHEMTTKVALQVSQIGIFY